MSDDLIADDLFAPEGGWRVALIDQSAPSSDNVTETVAGFPTLMQANAFARAYVRDSVERCRTTDARGTLDAWFAFGEDADVLDAGEAGWKSAAELSMFVDTPAGAAERDWRSLDPRRDDGLEPPGNAEAPPDD